VVFVGVHVPGAPLVYLCGILDFGAPALELGSRAAPTPAENPGPG
jgi:hypothetical protein